MRSPRTRACVRLSNTSLTITPASRRKKRGKSFTTSSMRSRFVMAVCLPGWPDRRLATTGRRRDGSALALVASLEVLGHDVGERELPALALTPHVGVDLVPLLAPPQRLDRERDPLLACIDLRDLGFDLVAHLVERRRTVHALRRERSEEHTSELQSL